MTRTLRRIRRLDAYFVVSCNGDDAHGCAFAATFGSGAESPDRISRAEAARRARACAWTHATGAMHETIVTDTNDGLVVDGRDR